MTKSHKHAHWALESWASHVIRTALSADGWSVSQFGEPSGDTPPACLIPRIAMFPNNQIRYVDFWYHDARPKLQENVYNHYLIPRSEQSVFLSKDQLYYLWDNVAEYLTKIRVSA